MSIQIKSRETENVFGNQTNWSTSETWLLRKLAAITSITQIELKSISYLSSST